MRVSYCKASSGRSAIGEEWAATSGQGRHAAPLAHLHASSRPTGSRPVETAVRPSGSPPVALLERRRDECDGLEVRQSRDVLQLELEPDEPDLGSSPDSEKLKRTRRRVRDTTRCRSCSTPMAGAASSRSGARQGRETAALSMRALQYRYSAVTVPLQCRYSAVDKGLVDKGRLSKAADC